MTDSYQLRYPIGKLVFPEVITEENIKEYINDLRNLPHELAKAVEGLNDEQLDTPYREGGWTVRQVVHHVADSHMNGYLRVKWTLTENNPLIKTYEQDDWVKLQDVIITPISVSINLLFALHERWVNLLSTLKPEELKRKLTHPENAYERLEQIIVLYAWHSKHHTAHITSLRKRMGW